MKRLSDTDICRKLILPTQKIENTLKNMGIKLSSNDFQVEVLDNNKSNRVNINTDGNQ